MIPVIAIIPFYIVSFVLLAFQYFRVNPAEAPGKPALRA